jgi:hypothetical protein
MSAAGGLRIKLVHLESADAAGFGVLYLRVPRVSHESGASLLKPSRPSIYRFNRMWSLEEMEK